MSPLAPAIKEKKKIPIKTNSYKVSKSTGVKIQYNI